MRLFCVGLISFDDCQCILNGIPSVSSNGNGNETEHKRTTTRKNIHTHTHTPQQYQLIAMLFSGQVKNIICFTAFK